MAETELLTGIRSFLGLLQFFRWFIPEFARIETSLTAPTRKGSEVHRWNEECEKYLTRWKTRQLRNRLLLLQTGIHRKEDIINHPKMLFGEDKCNWTRMKVTEWLLTTLKSLFFPFETIQIEIKCYCPCEILCKIQILPGRFIIWDFHRKSSGQALSKHSKSNLLQSWTSPDGLQGPENRRRTSVLHYTWV